MPSILFLNSYRKRNICHHFQENWSNFIFLPLYNLDINLRPLKPPNDGSMCRIWKIITFLEFLSQGEWSDIDLNNIQALLFFDPHDISKCSMMPKWHQFVPISRDVGESETVKTLQLYVTSWCSSVSTRLQTRNVRTFSDHSIRTYGLILWNLLDINVKRSKSIKYFKTQYKKHLICLDEVVFFFFESWSTLSNVC